MTKKRLGLAYLETVDFHVLIHGLKFPGMVSSRRCADCQRISVYAEDYDSCFCAARPDSPMSTGRQAEVKLEMLKIKREKRITRNQQNHHWLAFKGRKNR